MQVTRGLSQLAGTAGFGAGGAFVGAISHQDVLTWTGVIVAVFSAILSGAIAGYHKIRQAARAERIADREAEELAIRRQIAAQVELERKIDANSQRVEIAERAVTELVEHVGTNRPPTQEQFKAHG